MLFCRIRSPLHSRISLSPVTQKKKKGSINAPLVAIHQLQRLIVLSEPVEIIETPNPAEEERGRERVSCRHVFNESGQEGFLLESPFNPSLTPRARARVTRKRAQAEVGADVRDAAVGAGLDVGAAVEWALALPAALERLEQRVAALHPAPAPELLLEPLRDIVLRGEERGLDFVLAQPGLGEDTADERAAERVVCEAVLQRHRGDRFPFAPPLLPLLLLPLLLLLLLPV